MGKNSNKLAKFGCSGGYGNDSDGGGGIDYVNGDDIAL